MTPKQMARDQERINRKSNYILDCNPIGLSASIAGIITIIVLAVFIAPVFARDFLWMIPSYI